MTYQAPNQTHPPVEYTAALNHLRDTFTSLFELVNAYPEALREKEGACGWWSPRQVLAHLSGWVEEAIRRFHAYDAGVKDSVRYDDDAFNAQSVETRKDYDWQQTLDELRSCFLNLIALASKVDPERAAEDPRYRNWLRGLATDFEEHTQQLQAFIQ
jgi:hypothetical protein